MSKIICPDNCLTAWRKKADRIFRLRLLDLLNKEKLEFYASHKDLEEGEIVEQNEALAHFERRKSQIEKEIIADLNPIQAWVVLAICKTSLKKKNFSLQEIMTNFKDSKPASMNESYPNLVEKFNSSFKKYWKAKKCKDYKDEMISIGGISLICTPIRSHLHLFLLKKEKKLKMHPWAQFLDWYSNVHGKESINTVFDQNQTIKCSKDGFEIVFLPAHSKNGIIHERFPEIIFKVKPNNARYDFDLYTMPHWTFCDDMNPHIILPFELNRLKEMIRLLDEGEEKYFEMDKKTYTPAGCPELKFWDRDANMIFRARLRKYASNLKSKKLMNGQPEDSDRDKRKAYTDNYVKYHIIRGLAARGLNNTDLAIANGKTQEMEKRLQRLPTLKKTYEDEKKRFLEANDRMAYSEVWVSVLDGMLWLIATPLRSDLHLFSLETEDNSSKLKRHPWARTILMFSRWYTFTFPEKSNAFLSSLWKSKDDQILEIPQRLKLQLMNDKNRMGSPPYARLDIIQPKKAGSSADASRKPKSLHKIFRLYGYDAPADTMRMLETNTEKASSTNSSLRTLMRQRLEKEWQKLQNALKKCFEK